MRRVFFRSGKVTAVAHNGEAKQCQNAIMYAAGLYPIPEFDILVAGKGWHNLWRKKKKSKQTRCGFWIG